MYRNIIEFKDGLSASQMAALRECCIKAHDNSQGTIAIRDATPTLLVFEGKYSDWEALTLAGVILSKDNLFCQSIKNWWWEDEEPEECCDIAQSMIHHNYGAFITFTEEERARWA